MTTQVTAAKETVRGGRGCLEISKWYFAGLGGALQMTLYQNAELHFYTAIVVTHGTAWKWMGFKGKGGKTETKVRNKDWVFSQVNHPVSTKLFAYI